MKKRVGSFFVLVFLFCLWGIPSFAADPSEEMEQLKGEVKRLLQKIEELEKRQTETEMKAKEAEKKAIEIEKKTEEVKKKSLKDRIELGGEARFRIVLGENASTDEHFYGNGNLSEELKFRDETSFPLRIRLNAHAEVVPEWVDLYARLTMNTRWGGFEGSMSTV